MTLGFGVFLFGILLIYAGVKGKSVQRLLVGDDTVSVANTSVVAATSAPTTPSSSAGSTPAQSSAATAPTGVQGPTQ